MSPDLRADLDRALARLWHPVARSCDVGDQPVGVELLGEALVVWRPVGSAGPALVARDRCPHRGTALSTGSVEDGCLVCPYHGWRFVDDGACVHIPAQPAQRRVPTAARLHRYPAVERHGLIWTKLADDELLPLPSLGCFAAEGLRIIVGEPYVWSCHATRRLENFLDFAHFAFVHDGTLGSSATPEVPTYEVWHDRVGLRASQVRVEPPNAGVKAVDDTAQAITSPVEYECPTPLCGVLDQRLSQGRHFVLAVLSSPTNAETCTNFWILARDYDLDGDDEPYLRFQARVNEEDRRVIETLVPSYVSPDRTDGLHVASVDRTAVYYRRWLASLVSEVGPVPHPAGSRSEDDRNSVVA